MSDDDRRLEREVRDGLRRRDPGPAPDGLRALALGVPEAAPPRTHSLRPALSALLGLAAVVTLAVAAVSLTGRAGPGPAASPIAATAPASSSIATHPPASAEATPSATLAPSARAAGATPFAVETVQSGAGPAFDPTKDGTGVKVRVDSGDGVRILIVTTIVVLVVIALAGARGIRRIVPALPAAALGVWLLVASFAPVDLQRHGLGWGLYTYDAAAPLGFDQEVMYEVAPPGRHFTFALLDLHADALVPVTLDAVEAANLDPANFYGPAVTAAWLDREDSGNGGSSGPVAPLSPVDLSGYRTIWIAGRAGACSLGPSFNPQMAADDRVGATSIDRITVQITVLGIPRRVELPLGFSLVEPSPGQCPFPTTEPWVSPSPTPSPTTVR